jgi:hypothetical protein
MRRSVGDKSSFRSVLTLLERAASAAILPILTLGERLVARCKLGVGFQPVLSADYLPGLL